jgi:hypothetical protein
MKKEVLGVLIIVIVFALNEFFYNLWADLFNKLMNFIF